MSTIQLPYNKNPTQEEANTGSHGSNKRGRPFLFQVMMPGTNQPLYPVLLALHANPKSVEEKMTKNKTIVSTYGGFVEFVWPDDFDTISCSASTGAFISPGVGLTAGGDQQSSDGVAGGRHGTVAWERSEDLIELFHNNGMVYDGNGIPAIRGRMMVLYDRGAFMGHFTSFSVEEDDSHAFSFELSWEFHVEETLYQFPSYQASI